MNAGLLDLIEKLLPQLASRADDLAAGLERARLPVNDLGLAGRLRAGQQSDPYYLMHSPEPTRFEEPGLGEQVRYDEGGMGEAGTFPGEQFGMGMHPLDRGGEGLQDMNMMLGRQDMANSNLSPRDEAADAMYDAQMRKFQQQNPQEVAKMRWGDASVNEGGIDPQQLLMLLSALGGAGAAGSMADARG